MAASLQALCLVYLHYASTNPPPYASLVAQWLRIYLPMQELQETQILSLGQADPLEKEMATHSSVLV